jgi:hypothetical protein
MLSMTYLRRSLGAAALAALALSGCGSSPKPKTTRPTSLPQVVAHDNRICARYAPQIARIAPPTFTPASTKPSELPQAVSFLDKELPLLQSEYREIHAVALPTKLSNEQRTLYTSVLAALHKLLADERAARDAAAKGSVSGFRAALKQQSSDSTRLSGLAVQTGLTTCASG